MKQVPVDSSPCLQIIKLEDKDGWFRRKKPQKSDIRLPISISLLKRLIQSLSFVCFSLMNRCYLLPHLA
jgi:hypothetical protein